MIFTSSFKKTVLISLLGHLTVFSIFSFSFGDRIPKTNYADVYFWGALLRAHDLISRPWHRGKGFSKLNTSPLDRKNRRSPLLCTHYMKPPVSLLFNEEKPQFIENKVALSLSPKKREPMIIFYPQLPYHFLLYFKDRQAVHIELMFNIVSTDRKKSIVVKRKISSGNLEADLLSVRYISHYLFIQQARFSPNSWQIVKIDLGA